MAGGEGGVGGVDASGGGRNASVARRRLQQLQQQSDASQASMRLRRRPVSPIGAGASGPSTEEATEKHVLQADFTTASSSTMALPVEVVRDTDGRMTFYASQSPKCTEWFDDFDTATVGVPWTASNTGAGAFVYGSAADHVNATENAYGEFGVTSGTTTTGRACIYRSASSAIFGTAAFTLRWRGTVASVASAADDYVYQCGFLDNPTANAEPTNAAMIAYRRATDGNFWVCITRDNGSETKTVTSVVPADYATLHTFEITMNQAGTSCVFKIDGTTVATHTTNIPTAAGRRVGVAFKHYKTAGTNARYAYLDYVHLSTTRTTDR